MSDYYLQGIDSEIGEGHDFKVFCNGKVFIVAIHPTGTPDDQIRSVLSKYNTACSRNDDDNEQKVHSIKVPKLIGIVVDNGGIIGILEELVPSKHTLGKILMDSPAPDSERQKKWAQQLEQTLHQLHEIGVIWGDGKPDNILINLETDDAWLIDFGGSFTDGWVDVELNETLAVIKDLMDDSGIDQ
ncbi:hypothetical protein VE03_02048 [Pseudogymnoascus sp. 23342-1-I1]|nr:hypothetical protein VE03_02048 [Pseudogymnoascus sp. 23342-1-I1]